jgi:tRNA1Val (adenine37-N6)-methyltransferase
MSNPFFQFKQFTIQQDRCAMKVTTDACLFGAWAAREVKSQNEKAKNVLDIGTGTGLLSLMLAQKNPPLNIDAIEIDNGAYQQARENVAGSLYRDRINIINGDVKVLPFPGKYDIIISNPPFYEREIKSLNEKKNMAHHHSGLLLQELINIIKSNLTPAGAFYLLLPFKRNEELKRIFLRQDLSITKLVFVKQSTVHDYFRIMIQGQFKNVQQTETVIDEISVWNDQKEYTYEFKELLKDYYLHL